MPLNNARYFSFSISHNSLYMQVYVVFANTIRRFIGLRIAFIAGLWYHVVCERYIYYC